MVASAVKRQFDTRASTYNRSAKWITDHGLLGAFLTLAGTPSGRALELCCGTGVVGTTLFRKGWDITGLDISPGMLSVAQKTVPVLEASAEHIPFPDHSVSLVVLRQALFFLDVKKVFSQIRRVLKPRGTFILGQTVPFSEADTGHLRTIHQFKQAQLKSFYTAPMLERLLTSNGFRIGETKSLRVRESITCWMDNAPELSPAKRTGVKRLIRQAPEEYRRIHNVRTERGELWEDWHWVVWKGILLRT